MPKFSAVSDIFSVAHAQIPIIPIVISSYKQFYNRDKRYFANSGYVIVEIMDPIQTTGKTFQDVPILVNDIRTKMIDIFTKISEEIDEQFRNQQEQVNEKKS
ncbi:1-acyl-sn-glycerol-3-phosphate acyltransferase [Dirofilaria immitis]|nr:1-acyl-sn-glycerol-3-phosphate acyltransferase [Dirofilaria immitis]